MDSVLSMESPPFRPRGSGGFLGNGGGVGGGVNPFSPSGSSGFTSPYRTNNVAHHRGVSGSHSPLLGGGSGGESYSNVVRSYSFQAPNGYVSLLYFCTLGWRLRRNARGGGIAELALLCREKIGRDASDVLHYFSSSQSLKLSRPLNNKFLYPSPITRIQPLV